MNAVAETSPRAPVAAPHPTHTFKLLLKREFWEHKGGFFWAPIIVSAIAILFAVIGAAAGTVLGKQNDIRLDGAVEHSGDIAKVAGAVGDGALLGGIGLAMIVLAFVVFFYSLGSLYDDRRDRSILFWKSMPISDTQMVLSKLAWALVLAPLVAMAVGLATGIVMWVIAALTTTINGVPGGSGVFVHSHPFQIIGNVLLFLPVQILWSLPAVGWLMLCSAWSRRVPFLWAAMVPILACALISFTGIFPGVNIPHDHLWYTVVYRGLLSVAPGAWFPTVSDHVKDIEGPDAIPQLLDPSVTLQVFAQADIWIGAAIGAAMIYGAIRLRRWREEG